MKSTAALRRAIWVVVAGGIAALVLVGGVSLSQAISIRDAELVAGENQPVAGNEPTASVANLPEGASTEGLECGYVECEVALTVTKTANATVKGAPGGQVTYEIEVEVPAGAPGPVVIDSVIDDKFGDLELGPNNCALVGEQIDPGDSEDCVLRVTLPELSAGENHTNTVVVMGHVLDTNTQASGSDSETISIVEPQIDIATTYTVLTGSSNDCLAGGGTSEITVLPDTLVGHCTSVTNAGNTNIVNVESTLLGSTSITTFSRGPGWEQGAYSQVAALLGTTVYEYKVVATDEWGNTDTEILEVTVNGVPNVELTVNKIALTPIKGAPGGIVEYRIEVSVPLSAPGPVQIDSIVDDALGDLSLDSFNCEELFEDAFAPGESESCTVSSVLTGLSAGDTHTNTVTVKGHVVGETLQAAGQDSATVSIVEPVVDVEAFYTLAATTAECADDGPIVFGALLGFPVAHCSALENTGNTTIVSWEMNLAGFVLNRTDQRNQPGDQFEVRAIERPALLGLTTYTLEVTVTDEWGNTASDFVSVTVLGGL